MHTHTHIHIFIYILGCSTLWILSLLSWAFDCAASSLRQKLVTRCQVYWRMSKIMMRVECFEFVWVDGRWWEYRSVCSRWIFPCCARLLWIHGRVVFLLFLVFLFVTSWWSVRSRLHDLLEGIVSFNSIVCSVRRVSTFFDVSPMYCYGPSRQGDI